MFDMGRAGQQSIGGNRPAALFFLGAVFAAFLLEVRESRADYLADAWPNPVPPFDGDTLFPNWQRAPTASFQLWEYCDCTFDADKCPNTGDGWCEESRIVSLTVMNFGTAGGGPSGDIRNVYFRIVCGTNVVPNATTFTMTYAGVWPAGAEFFPTWTWSGAIAINGDPCGAGGEPGCGDPLSGGYMDLFLYTDISGCPTENATVALGPAFNDLGSTMWEDWGGIRAECTAPETSDQSVPQIPKLADAAEKFLRYAMKRVDKNQAAPGDTVTYTIYYATPGVVTLSSLELFDTIPSYMTVLQNSTTWFENINPPAAYKPGPPASLLWSIPGPINPAGGATREVMFRATVDWQNEPVESNSGSEAAPEGAFLFNQARVVWDPQGAGCPSGGNSNRVSTVVKRYLFWVLGDQDVMFAPKAGQDADQITYSLYVKNLSDSRTWWNVRIWDTVPELIDVWAYNMGFNDPFAGWTMTPTGAAAGNPGVIVSGTNTLLTWTTDVPPGFTLELKFKGQLKSDAEPGDRILNKALIMALGDWPKIDGTGPAKRPRVFRHEATVVLRTTFVSYVGYAGSDDAWTNYDDGCATPLYFISFYPLNKATNLSVFRKLCCSGGTAPCDPACTSFAEFGGVSPRIDQYAGRCEGTDFPGDWEGGCAAERAPARYMPSPYSAGYTMGNPPLPFNFLHKLVATAPLVWEVATCLTHTGMDADTFTGASSMNFIGYITYTWLRRDITDHKYPLEDGMHIVNTDDDNPTTIFVFEWSGNAWRFRESTDIYNGSMWGFGPLLPLNPPWGAHFRVVSSDTRILVHKVYGGLMHGGGYNDMGTLGVCRDTGNLVNATAPSTFYIFGGHLPGAADVCLVGNLAKDGDPRAEYDVFRYRPFDPLAVNISPENLNVDLVGNAGSWHYMGSAAVDSEFKPGSTNPGTPSTWNPHVYGDEYDTSTFLTRYRLYKIVLKQGGPIQVYCGRNIIDRYSGAAMIHPSVPAGEQAGTEYWLHTNESAHQVAGIAVEVLDVFCPEINQEIRCESSDEYDSTYTTDSVDQCVAFKAITMPVNAGRVNWRVTSVAGGEVIMQYVCINITEKFYTAPFLKRGTFYDVFMPPVVYAGQPFCLTVVVVSNSGATKLDYCGISHFSSTDPNAQMAWGDMESADYSWTTSWDPTCISGDDDGLHVFCNVIFRQLGPQSLLVSDTQDGSITGMAVVQVVGVSVKFRKEPAGTTAASGDVLNFRICWSNFGSGSALDFVVTDRVPSGFEYIPGEAKDHFCGATYGFGTAPFQSSVAYSVSGNSHGDFTTLNPLGGLSPSNVTWLRWTIPQAVGTNTTGCVCFKAKVN